MAGSPGRDCNLAVVLAGCGRRGRFCRLRDHRLRDNVLRLLGLAARASLLAQRLRFATGMCVAIARAPNRRQQAQRSGRLNPALASPGKSLLGRRATATLPALCGARATASTMHAGKGLAAILDNLHWQGHACHRDQIGDTSRRRDRTATRSQEISLEPVG